MKQVNVLLLFLLFITFNSFGTSVYIDYNASKDCMDSYEYTKDNNEETPYLFFHLKISDNEKIILEAGEEYTPRQYKPAGTETCSDLERDEQFVDDVNSGALEVYLVREHTYGYRIYQVKKAEYYYNTNIAFGSRSENYSFSYYYNQAATGNLATKGSEADVFFDEKDDNDCLSRYKFRVKTDPNRIGMSDLTILPEIGVLYKKSDPMPPLAVGQKLELKKINDYNIVDYLGLICKFYGGQPNTTGTGTSSASTGKSSGSSANSNTGKGDLLPGNRNTNTTPTPATDRGRIYLDGDKGRYIDRITGKYAEGEHGGNKYSNGYMLGKNAPNTSGRVYNENDNNRTTYNSRIYYDLDRKRYFDRNTGARAEGEHGGNSYRDGLMINKSTGTTGNVVSNPTPVPTDADRGCLEVSTSDTHIVQKQETLYSIARTYGLNMKDIKKWNKIGANNRIYPCMRLTIVPPVTVTDRGNAKINCEEQPTYNTHVVQKGETLFSIAATYGVSVNQIKAWNGLRRNAIYPCTRLTIQPPSDYQVVPRNTGVIYAQPQLTTVVPSTRPTSYSYIGEKGARYHTVAKSETLFRIAALYGMRVVELKQLNNLSSNLIQPGQVLIIAQSGASIQPQSTGTRMIAVPQEYVYVNPAIAGATRTNSTPIVTGKGSELIEVNIDGNQRLIHIVQDEDTLVSIANQYSTTVAKLRALNDMDRNEVIVPFQRLYVR